MLRSAMSKEFDEQRLDVAGHLLCNLRLNDSIQRSKWINLRFSDMLQWRWTYASRSAKMMLCVARGKEFAVQKMVSLKGFCEGCTLVSWVGHCI